MFKMNFWNLFISINNEKKMMLDKEIKGNNL